MSASSNWNAFYRQNRANFFKDRHYLHKAFPEEFGWLYDQPDSLADPGIVQANDSTDGAVGVIKKFDSADVTTNDPDAIVRVVEIGCGVGNAILPLVDQHSELMKRFHESNGRSSCKAVRRPPELHIHCLDFAPTAIELLTDDNRFQTAAKEGRATAHVYDLSSTHPSTIHIGMDEQCLRRANQSSQVLAESADVAILLFCISAIGPHPSPSLSRAARKRRARVLVFQHVDHQVRGTPFSVRQAQQGPRGQMHRY